MRLRLASLILCCATLTWFAPAAYGQQDTTAVVAAPTALVAADSALATQLRFLYSGFDEFAEVTVAVHGGVVRLGGTVIDPEQRDRAEAMASAVAEVVYVLNDIETSLAVDARVTPAFERVQTYLTDGVAYLPVLGVALVVLIVFWVLAAFAGRLRTPFMRLGMTPLVSNLMGRLLRFLVWIIGVVLALDVLGITALVGAVLGTAGLVGIAIGFAFQDIIENYLAGLILSIRQPFGLGDHVKVGSEEGKVVRLTSRELVLMTLDGNHVSIPNANVFKSTVYNYSRNPRRRFSFEVGVDVDEDLTQVQQIGLRTMRALPAIMTDPGPMMLIKALGDFNVVVTFFGWVDQAQADFSKARSETIRLVKTALDEAGVLMPEPIYNVRMQSVNAPPAPTTLERKAEKKPERPAAEQARTADTTVDTEIEDQIREDLARSDEPNLLRT